MFSMAMWMAAIVAPIQTSPATSTGLNTLEHQPAKIAAIEGHFETESAARRCYLFGLPDMQAEETQVRDRDPEARQPDPDPLLGRRDQGLKAFPRDQRPNAPVVF